MNEHWQERWARLHSAGRQAGRAVFGDRYGLVLFLATVCFVTTTWRAGVFINDTYTLVRGLDALSEGRFWLNTAGPDAISAPGTTVRDGYVYGRNYGQLLVSMPVLWALQAIDAVVNLHVAVVAGWHLLALALVSQLTTVTRYEQELLVGGSGFVGASFLLNIVFVRTFTGVSLPLLALQVTTAFAAGLLAVFGYRLVERRHGRTVGLFAGAGIVVATPVTFWATVPKRHVLTALVVVVVLYAFTRSRDDDARVTVRGVGPVPLYRAGMYALVGLYTTVHAAEALFVFSHWSPWTFPRPPRTTDGRWRSSAASSHSRWSPSS